jgi:hypothetical protein
MDTPNADLLTKLEAKHWLETRELPDNFGERVENFVEFYECTNCGGVQDMNIVLRDWWGSEGPSWCPDCTPPEGPVYVGDVFPELVHVGDVAPPYWVDQFGDWHVDVDLDASYLPQLYRGASGAGL